jgi:two-component sensor histidine kinase
VRASAGADIAMLTALLVSWDGVRREAHHIESGSESWLASQHVGSSDLTDRADRLFLERVRLGLRLVLAGIAVVFVGELLVHPGERPGISIVQAINFVFVAGTLYLLTDQPRRWENFALGFAAFAVTVVSVGAVGIIADDPTSTVILLVGLAVVTGALVPWSPWWQLVGVLLIAATGIWTVATVVKTPHLFWIQNIGAIAPTLGSTVFISYALRRQRAAVERAESQRRSREDSLREANRRLEQEIREHQRTEGALRFAMRELDHRVKNTLATVQAVADQTVRAARSMDEFSEAFEGRIQALARIHTALAARRWEGLALTELIELVVGPYRHHASSVAVECDASFVSSELVRVLGMTLHELATNAAKYGALSTREGRVAISSARDVNGASRLRICWSELAGPPVQKPQRRGFGVRLIEEALAYETEGSVSLRFLAEGIRCEIDIPVAPGSA